MEVWFRLRSCVYLENLYIVLTKQKHPNYWVLTVIGSVYLKREESKYHDA